MVLLQHHSAGTKVVKRLGKMGQLFVHLIQRKYRIETCIGLINVTDSSVITKSYYHFISCKSV